MQLTFNNCFIQSGSGTNYAFANCCCTFNCSFTNDQENELGQVVQIDVDDIAFGWQLGNFGLNNSTITVGGNPVSAPFVLGPNETLDFAIEFCSGEFGVSDVWTFELTLDGTTVQIVSGDFEAINLSGISSPSTINFGTILVNSTETVELTITNPSICCDFFSLTTDCPDLIIDPERPFELCTSDSGKFYLSWTPTTIGPINCNVTLIENCSGLELTIPVLGNAVETLPSGGNDVSGKRTVVDCPTGDCRLFNPQPGFAQTTKNAMNQISRVTRPKGGAGRGTNFRK